MRGQTNYTAADFRKEWNYLREEAGRQFKLGWHAYAAYYVSNLLSLEGVAFILSDQKEIFFGQWLKDAAYKKIADVEIERILTDGQR